MMCGFPICHWMTRPRRPKAQQEIGKIPAWPFLRYGWVMLDPYSVKAFNYKSKWGYHGLLVGGFEHVLFSIIYGMSSFPLTFIFFRGVGIPPTRLYQVRFMVIGHYRIQGKNEIHPMAHGKKLVSMARFWDPQ